MHRVSSSRWLTTALQAVERQTSLDVQLPLFLCPTLLSGGNQTPSRLTNRASSRRLPWGIQRRNLHGQAEETTPTIPAVDTALFDRKITRKLPAQCTGCGAFSQSASSDQPGYFDLSRKAVRLYTGLEDPKARRIRNEEALYKSALARLDLAELEKLGLDMDDITPSLSPALEPQPPELPRKVPVCDRCHQLLHHKTGNPIFHPTIESIRDTLNESPYKYNHVYHVLDAADFPMSILPQINQLLDLMPLRTQNRRSTAGRYFRGKKTEMSFIITRSDLLAPTEEMVNRLVPTLREILRDRLGRAGSDLRLGNLRCVSAQRSWWTKELKEEIWQRGGAGWLVGKVNVGKSKLFEAVFPKGRMDWTPSEHQISIDMFPTTKPTPPPPQVPLETEDSDDSLFEKLPDPESLSGYDLLPPAQPETQYPDMPLVSALPGTTASPIRVPFGNGKGELIDLPGLERTGLEKYVKEEDRSKLVMHFRTVPEQIVIKQGKSVLLGGLIRITPRVPGPIMMAYSFTPIAPHLTRTEKAIALQEQTEEAVQVLTIASPNAGKNIKFAGSFPLKWDVTRERSGPITAKNAVGMKVDRLPYRVQAADILIEGVGWVEVVAQVRVKDLYSKPLPPSEKVTLEDEGEKEQETSRIGRRREVTDVDQDRRPPPPTPADTYGDLNWPIVDVYSPEGKFVGCRRPINGWELNQPQHGVKKTRPRKSMKGEKKQAKVRKLKAEIAVREAPPLVPSF